MNFKSYFKKSLVLLILLQPFLDVYFLYVPPVTDWIPFSPATLVRILLMGIITVLYLLSIKGKKKDLFPIIYVAILIVYLIGHIAFTKNFTSTNPDDFNYSIFGEIFYWIRMVIPLILIYVTKQSEISKFEFNKIVKFLTWIISGSIVITNLFKFSLSSYGGGWIQGNIISWFSGQHHWMYYGLASKGFFYYANAISALEILLTPIVLYFVVEKLNIWNVALAFVQMLAMLMLGTKVASIGFFIVLLIYICMYFIYTLVLKKMKFHFKVIGIFLLLIAIGGSILPFSPMFNRTSTDIAVQEKKGKQGDQEELEKIKDKSNKKTDKRKETPLMRYIKKNYDEYSLNERFVLEGYTYKDDPDFWYGVMKWPIGDRMNYRKLEGAMLDRAKNVNNSSITDWFGISYTRMNQIANLEQDFISQWYSMGYLGVLLLLGPYIMCVIYCLVKLLSKLKKDSIFYEASLLLGVGLIIAMSWFSGNVMDFLADTIIMSFTLGFLISRLNNSEKEVINDAISKY